MGGRGERNESMAGTWSRVSALIDEHFSPSHQQDTIESNYHASVIYRAFSKSVRSSFSFHVPFSLVNLSPPRRRSVNTSAVQPPLVPTCSQSHPTCTRAPPFDVTPVFIGEQCVFAYADQCVQPKRNRTPISNRTRSYHN